MMARNKGYGRLKQRDLGYRDMRLQNEVINNNVMWKKGGKKGKSLQGSRLNCTRTGRAGSDAHIEKNADENRCCKA